LQKGPSSAWHEDVLSLPRFVFVAFAILLARESAFGANKKPPLRPANLNTATVQELQQVPGIAPATADKILKMRKYVTVGRAAPPKKAVDATAPGSTTPDPVKPPPQAPPRTVNQKSARSALRIALQKSNRPEGSATTTSNCQSREFIHCWIHEDPFPCQRT